MHIVLSHCALKAQLFCIWMFLVAVDFNAVTVSSTPSVCPPIITKSEWGGRLPLEVDYTLVPLPYVIVHHTVSSPCTTKASCAEIVKSIQNFHMEELEYTDIGLNFLVGGDGWIYEGAGWHKEGAHTYGYNKKSIGLAFIGTFSDVLPSESALNATKNLLECGKQMGELDENFKLLAGRQVISTQSPGLKLYNELKKWKHWSKEVK